MDDCTAPLALVAGKPLFESPKDLFIPPEALRVFLEIFEGPLDLLLYLIRRQHLDILNLPLATITAQYMSYVEAMQALDLELVADYLVMAAWLAEIKSRMLLPKPPADTDEEEDDPRLMLAKRLQQYALYKDTAEKVGQLPRLERDHYIATVDYIQDSQLVELAPDVVLHEIASAMEQLLTRVATLQTHQVHRETLSTRAKMSEILAQLMPGTILEFHKILKIEEGRSGVVVTLLALLALVRDSLIRVMQSEPLGPLYVGLKDEPETRASQV